MELNALFDSDEWLTAFKTGQGNHKEYIKQFTI